MMNEYDIQEALKRIEDELIASMIRNMDRHRAEETKEGFEWGMWQAEQLKALEEYKKRNKERYKDQFGEINSSIPALISESRKRGYLDQEAQILESIGKGASRGQGDIDGSFFQINDRKMNALIDATVSDMDSAETAMLRRANDQYRKTIFNAQVYANSGVGTYEKAVDMATKDFLAAGIQCIQYKNGSMHRIEEYAGMAIRTASKRAYLTGEGEKRREWGCHLVIMNKRGNPCPKCLPFVGKILIDDVWSGGSSKDGSYPLMSSAMAAGLYHPNCKDSHTTYFPGISTPPDDKFSREEIKQVEDDYKDDQKQQYAQRQEEKFDRLSTYSLDSENKRKYAIKKAEWEKVSPAEEDKVRSLLDTEEDVVEKAPEINLKDKITNMNNKLAELKQEFSNATEGYSYDEWFKEYDSIEDGFGGVVDDDGSFEKLKNLDTEIKEITREKERLKELLPENMSIVDELKEDIANNNDRIADMVSEYAEKSDKLNNGILFGTMDVDSLNKLSSEVKGLKASIDELNLKNDELKDWIPDRTQTKHSTVVNGSDLSGDKIDYSTGKFDHDIETAMNAQGFDGVPSVVEYEEFEKAMEESGFYAERTYSAETQELLDTYRDELYNGKWYVDCSDGGSQYGQGMYCASSYDLTDNHSLGGIEWEMSHYQEIGMSKGRAFSYTESITLQPNAKIFHLPNEADAGEYISDKYMQHCMLKDATDKSYIKDVNEYFNTQDRLIELGKKYDAKEITLDEYERRQNAIYAYRDAIYYKNPELQKAKKKAMEQQMYKLPDMKYPKLKDPGTLAVEMGYDAIKAEGHGESGSYTVILNRTKVIFCKGGSIYGN